MDLGNIWNQVTSAVGQGLDDLSKTAVPALEASLEQHAINILTDQKKAAQENLKNGIQEIQSRPVTPGSFADTFSSVVTEGFTSANGIMILSAGAAILVLGYFIFKGR